MAKTNEELVQELVRDGYLKSPRLIEAFKKIDRKDFVPRELQGEAYVNYPLPIGEGQTISQPCVVAFMLELLDPKVGEKILDIGSGSAWTTALLAFAVGESGHVVAVERISELCEMGKVNVSKYSFIDAFDTLSVNPEHGRRIEKGVVKFFCGDATMGIPQKLLPEGGFNKILAGASAQTEIPEVWRDQLKVGGRIVAPVGSSIMVLDKVSGKDFRQKEYFGFRFVPLIKESS